MPGHLPGWRQCIPQASTRTADRCVGHQNHHEVVTDSFPVSLGLPAHPSCYRPPVLLQKSALTTAILPEPGMFRHPLSPFSKGAEIQQLHLRIFSPFFGYPPPRDENWPAGFFTESLLVIQEEQSVMARSTKIFCMRWVTSLCPYRQHSDTTFAGVTTDPCCPTKRRVPWN